MEKQLDFTTKNYNKLLKEPLRISFDYNQLEKWNAELEDGFDNLQSNYNDLKKNTTRSRV